MRKIFALLIVITTVIFGSFSTVFATSNITISLQGVLLGPNGLVDGTFNNVSVNIYSDTSTVIWSEGQTVTFNNGAFNITLGQTNLLSTSNLNVATPNLGLIIPAIQPGPLFIPITSVPYALSVRHSEEVLAPRADRLVGSLPSANIRAPLIVDTNSLVVKPLSNRVGIGTTAPVGTLHVAGTLNATELYLGGAPLVESLAWKPTTNNRIFFDGRFAGVNTNLPTYNLDVAGAINADNFLVNGTTIVADLDWQITPSDSNSIFLTNLTANVGIGRIAPVTKLDVNGGIFLQGTPLPTTLNAGTIIFNGLDIFGILTTTNNQLQSLTGVRGSGGAGGVAYWQTQQALDSDGNLFWNQSTNSLGIGTRNTTALLTLTVPNNQAPTGDFIRVTNSENITVFRVPVSGNIGIRTTTANYDVDVNGTVNASNYLIGGVPILLEVSTGSFWRTDGQRNIFYLRGDVGIGRPDPDSRAPTQDTVLEIAAPNHLHGVPTRNPELTINFGDQTFYTMGVINTQNNVFRVEQSRNLGGSQPLFVSVADRFGIGLEFPSANLHVNGNSGAAFVGVFDSTPNLTFPVTSGNIGTEGPGTRFFFYPPRAAFRVGHVDTTAPLGGTDWDILNLGLYSMGMGYNALASGNYSTVLGGVNNIAGGAYATIIGGDRNRAIGDFSWAGGQRAGANEHGSFVWNGFSLSPVEFASVSENQFLVNVENGVGINTNDTIGNALTFLSDRPTGNLFHAMGNSDGANALVITSSGNVGMGVGLLATASLSIIGGPTYIGSSTADASLVVADPTPFSPAVSRNLLFAVVGNQGTPSPSLAVTGFGPVGIGIRPRVVTENEIFLQIVSGNILATQYGFPDGTIIGLNPVVVWEANIASPNIFFPSANVVNGIIQRTGNVGIGTTDPGSILELGNSSINGFPHAAIGFSIPSNNFHHVIGIHSSTPSLLRIQDFGSFGTNPATMSFATANVGFGVNHPAANLHAANMIVSGLLRVDGFGVDLSASTADVSAGSMNISQGLRLNGQLIGGTGTPFGPGPNPNNIFTLFPVSIGTNASPNGLLEVNSQSTVNVGISANSMVVGTLLRVGDTLSASGIEFRRSQLFGSSFLRVRNGELILDNGAVIESISDVFTVGTSTANNLPLAFWVDDGVVLAESNLFWNNNPPSFNLTLNGVFNFRNSSVTNSFIVSNNVNIGLTNNDMFFNIASTLNRGSGINNSQGNSGQVVSINIASWPTINGTQPNVWFPNNPPLNRPVIIGTRIDMVQPANRFFTRNSFAYGIDVDVSNVQVQTSVAPGFRYSGIFLGNVGIGATPNIGSLDPSLTENFLLEVAGRVSANNFIISNRLNISTINVGNGVIFVGSGPNVGFGTTNPETLLEVEGAVSVNSVRIQDGTLSRTLQANSTFFVTDQNTVGINVPNPTAQFDILKTFRTIETGQFSLKTNTVVISNNYDANLQGIEVNVSNASIENTFGVENGTARFAKGVNINLAGIELATSNTRGIGLEIIASGSVASSNIARFIGGNVGIGTTSPVPTVALHIIGTLRGTNVNQGSFSTTQRAAEFGNLIVTGNPFNTLIQGPASANSLAADTITASSLDVTGMLNLSGLGVSLDVTNLLLVEGDVTLNSGVSANTGIIRTVFGPRATFLGGLGVGEPAPAQNLNVDQNVSANNMFVSDQLVSVTMNHTNRFVVDDNGRIGIGTSAPFGSLVHVRNTTPFQINGVDAPFSATNNLTWNPVRFQNPSASPNTAAGIVLIPDPTTAVNTGSGVAGVKIASGSYLTFITDPDDGDPAVRMTILTTGNVGIGTQTPASLLDLAGTFNVRNQLTAASTLNVNFIEGINGLTLTSTLNLSVTVDISANLISDTLIAFQPGPTPNALTGHGGLFTFLNGDFGFMTFQTANVVVTANLTQPFNFIANTLPHYNTANRLEGSDLHWTTSNVVNTLNIGLNEFQVGLSVTNTLNNTVRGTYTFKEHRIGFDHRSDPSVVLGDHYFNGVFVTSGDGPHLLLPEEKLIGFISDLVDVDADSLDPDGDRAIGTKYPAIFLGGGIGIGVSAPGNANNPTYNANLHIHTERPVPAGLNLPEPDKNALWVVSRDSGGVTRNALIVGPQGHVALNQTDTTGGQLTILGKSNGVDDIALDITNLAGNQILVAKNNQFVGIGTSLPQNHLHVVGQLPFRVTSLVSTYNMTVSSNGFVGINTATMDARLHIAPLNSIDPTIIAGTSLTPNALYVSQLGYVGIATSSVSPTFPLNVAGRIQVGTGTGSSRPAWMFDANTGGLMLTQGNDFGFLGHRNRVGAAGPITAFDTVIAWGDNLDDNLIFENYNGVGSSTEVMRITGAGLVGIGQSVPSASLHITGTKPFWIDAAAMPAALVVTNNGWVGIGTSMPVSLLDVSGDSQIFTVENYPTFGTLVQGITANVLQGDGSPMNFKLNPILDSIDTPAFTAQRIDMSIVTTFNSRSNFAGYDLRLNRNTIQNNRVFDDAIAYGMRVDVRQLFVGPLDVQVNGQDTTSGNRYAAIFTGSTVADPLGDGHVGIGNTTPSASITVNGMVPTGSLTGSLLVSGDVALFQGPATDNISIPANFRRNFVRLFTYVATDNRALNLANITNSANWSIGVQLTATASVSPTENPSPTDGIFLVTTPADGLPNPSTQNGRVGIGVSNPDKTLNIGGEWRVGIVASPNSVVVEDPGFGSRLFFSGGPMIGDYPNRDSDNANPLWIARFNSAAATSLLRINAGDDTENNVNAAFIVGFNETFDQDNLTVLNKTHVAEGRGFGGFVGINTAVPSATLHVVGTAVGDESVLDDDFVVIFQSTANANTTSNILAIAHSNGNADSEDENYVTFYMNESGTLQSAGAIEGNSASSITFASGDADYAEYLLKASPTEVIHKGEVVGIFSGKVSKRTEGADNVMVMSSAPAVSGGFPRTNIDDYALVAFLGQVPVKVRGTVNVGDYLVPSGREDGTAMAVHPNAISSAHINRIIGQAWSDSRSGGLSTVRAVIGFPFDVIAYQKQQQTMIQSLQEEIQELEFANATFKEKYLEKIANRKRQIKAIKASLN